MRLKEKIRISISNSMIEELHAYGQCFQTCMQALIDSPLMNAHVQDFPYYKIENTIAPASKVLLVRMALASKNGIKLPTGFDSAWHPESFQRDDNQLTLFPGYKFSCNKILCVLEMSASQRILMRTHNVLQVNILHTKQGWFASFDIESKPLAMIRRTVSIYRNPESQTSPCQSCIKIEKHPKSGTK